MELRCLAYSFSRDLAIKNLLKFLNDNYKLTIYDGVLHIKIVDASLPPVEGDVFIFPYGVMVSWGLTEAKELEVREVLQKFTGRKLGAEDSDLCTYSYGGKASILDDHITLPYEETYNKLACSYGLAQSVKLGGFEQTIEGIISLTRDLPEGLAKDGNIRLSRKEIRKLMGRIFVDRNSINLHLKLLDVPNFFWEHTDLEPFYDMIIEYMSVKQRLEVLNKQLYVMHELLEILGNELNNQHSSKLEWIIIVLIGVEILFDILHLYIDYLV